MAADGTQGGGCVAPTLLDRCVGISKADLLNISFRNIYIRLLPAMPYKRRAHGRRRAAPKRTRKPRVPLTLSGFPRAQLRKFTYVDTVGLGSTVGALDVHQFRANSLFDPDLTGTGHQPFGFDQAALYYNHYDVLSAKITLKSTSGTVITLPYAFGIYLSDDSSTYIDWRYFAEAKRGTHRIVGNESRNVVTCSGNFNKKRFWTKSMAQSTTTAAVTANPSEIAVFNLWFQPLDRASSTTTALFQVIIEFTARMFEPKDILPS